MTVLASPPPSPRPAPASALIRRIAMTVLLIGGVTVLAVVMRAAMGGAAAYRTPPLAIWIHLTTAVPAVPLGVWLLWRPAKGDAAHRIGGRVWALLMLVTAIDSFWIRTLTGTIGPIHIFSVLTLVQLPRAVWFARTGQVDRHLKAMRGVFFGLIAAGVFAMAPGRTLWRLLFG